MACVRNEDVWLPDKLVASSYATPSIPNESTTIEIITSISEKPALRAPRRTWLRCDRVMGKPPPE